MKELFRDIEIKMKQGVEAFQHELRQVRTGRASISILDGVLVEYYGTPTPLNQVANLSVADASLINAQPFDPSSIGAIEKAIHASGLGLNPSNDGRLIRIPVPPLTEDRRKELVKVAHDMAEKARNWVRQARREGNDSLRKMEKEKEISKDEEHTGEGEVQMLHDHYIKRIAEILEHKEKDILEV